MGTDTSDYISLPEAAQRAGVARNTIRLAAQNEKIKAVKIGRDWRIDPTDIDRWKAENYQPYRAYRYPVKSSDSETTPSSNNT